METPKTQLSSALRSAGRKRSGRRPRHCARSAIRGAWDAALALCAGCPRKCARGRGGLTWLPAVSAGMSSRSTASPLRRRRCGNSSRAAGLWRRRRRARHTAMRPSRSPWTTSSRRRFALRGASGAAAGRDTVLCLRHRSGDGGVAKTAALAFRWRLARVVRFTKLPSPPSVGRSYTLLRSPLTPTVLYLITAAGARNGGRPGRRPRAAQDVGQADRLS